MDTKPTILFDGLPGINLTQGEDRTIAITVTDASNNGLPINMTGAIVDMNLPLLGGGNIHRANFGLLIAPSEISPTGTPPLFTVEDHGFVSFDPVQFSVTSPSVLPGGISASTTYYVQTIDVNTFYLTTDVAGLVPVVLTTVGTGTFAMQVFPSDISVTSGDLGVVALTLRAAVTQVINDGLAQDMQFSYMLSGKTRVVVVPSWLDVMPQVDA